VIDADGTFSEYLSKYFEEIFEVEVGDKDVATTSDNLVEAT
jgi:hypothetical protein